MTLGKFAYPLSRLHRVTSNRHKFAVSCKYHIMCARLTEAILLEAYRSVLRNDDATRVTASRTSSFPAGTTRSYRRVPSPGQAGTWQRHCGCDVKLDLALRVAINCSRSQEPRSTHCCCLLDVPDNLKPGHQFLFCLPPSAARRL